MKPCFTYHVMSNPDAVAIKGTRSNGENVVSGRAGDYVVGPARLSSRETPQLCMRRIASLNVGTMKDRSAEVVETLQRRNIDFCCVQETHWRGGSA